MSPPRDTRPERGAPALARASGRATSAAPPAVPDCVLVIAAAFGARMPAAAVTEAIARGLRAGGVRASEQWPLATHPPVARDLEVRLRDARAVVVAQRRLRERTLQASPAFEIATRARQAGVPAYAIASENRLDAFDARMLDLQLVLEAASPRALTAAGRRLAAYI